MSRARLLCVVSVLAVALIAFGLRWRAVELLPIDYDEDDYLKAGQQYARLIRARDWRGFLETNYRPEHPPFVKIAYGVALSFLPAAPEIPDQDTLSPPAESLPEPHLTVARGVSAAAGTLEALGLALVNPAAGLFLAIHTSTIEYTSKAMLEAIPAMTALLAVLCYDRARRRRRRHDGDAAGRSPSRAAPSWPWLALSAFFLGLTAASKWIYCVAGAAIAIHWLSDAKPPTLRQARSWPGWIGPIAAWAAFAVAVFLAASPYFWPDPIGRILWMFRFHAAYSTGETVRAAAMPLWQPLAVLLNSVPWYPGVFLLPLDTMTAVLAVVGLKQSWARRRLYVIWLVLGLAFLLIWPTRWAQYVLIITAPLSVAASVGLRHVVMPAVAGWWARRRERQAARASRPRAHGAET